ncbi:MAG: tyrosine-type recombinase/integrase [Aliiglaciecola sp.]|uniref:tyrosine-type recombinase/integrase n=1 Tax=Aliiglaciecola sp. TaxID=1872441 RepID=UPI0032979853
MIAVQNFPYLYRRNGKYYLRFTIDSKQVWLSLKTDSLESAVLIRAQIKPLLSSTLVFATIDSKQLPKLLHTIRLKINSSLVEIECVNLQKSMLSKGLIPAGSPHVKSSAPKPRFSLVAKESLKRSKASLKGLEGYKRNLEIWLNLVKDKPIDQYTTREIGQFIDRCFQLPASNKSPYNRMSWKERVKCKVTDESEKISKKSVGAIYKWLKSVFAFAASEEIGYIQKDPCAIKRNFKQEKRGFFNDTELMQIQEKVMKPAKPWQKWITLLAMYHGMRRGEICQIRRGDIQIDPETKRPFIFVREIDAEQNVKNANSIRKIPIHKTILKLGFIDWITKKEGKIFADVKAHSVTGWFSRFIADSSISSYDEYGNVRSFHSLRHSFITKVRNVYPNLHHIQEVVGHRLQHGQSTDIYTHRITQLIYLISVVDSFTLN